MRDAALAVPPRDRRRDRRLERAVRGRPADRPPGPDRDEPARLALVARSRRRRPGSRSRRSRRCSPSGYRLDEITNDITGETPGRVRADARLRGREDPAVRVREVPRGRPALTSTMKSVGEVMAIGRTFKEALGKAWRGLEKAGFDLGAEHVAGVRGATCSTRAARDGTEHRLHLVERGAARRAHGRARSRPRSGIDPWFVDQIAEVVEEADGAPRTPAARRSARRGAARRQAARAVGRARWRC